MYTAGRLGQDRGGVFRALLTDLSKAFECIPNDYIDYIIDKLEAYGLEIGTLKRIHAHLINSKQRVKVNEAYSYWKDIIFGVPQGSTLGPLLFDIHLCGLFYFLEDFDIASYADDTPIYTSEKNNGSVIAALETSSDESSNNEQSST